MCKSYRFGLDLFFFSVLCLVVRLFNNSNQLCNQWLHCFENLATSFSEMTSECNSTKKVVHLADFCFHVHDKTTCDNK